MNRSFFHQSLGFEPEFVPPNNAGAASALAVGRITFSRDCGEGFVSDALGRKWAVPQIEYKGPLVSDKQQPHDIAVRAAANRTYSKKPSVEERAKAWIEAHPQIYQAFVLMAFDEASFTKRGSAKFIAECLRRRRDLIGSKPFKIPNACVTYMALRFMEEHPEHSGLFQTTKRK